ncbi:Nn.00g030590.m01.CDS01 [Neocucurbitaria sp. VM-36]
MEWGQQKPAGWFDFNFEEDEANNPQTAPPQQFASAYPYNRHTLPSGSQLPYATPMGHLPGPSFTNPQIANSQLPLLNPIEPLAFHLSGSAFPNALYPPFGFAAPFTPISYPDIPSNVSMSAGGQSQNGAPLPPAQIHDELQAPRVSLSTASEAQQQQLLLRARQRQAIEESRETSLAQPSTEINGQRLQAQTRLAYGQQQHGAHESHLGPLTNEPNIRTAAPSCPSLSSNGMHQAPASRMLTTANISDSNTAASNLHRSPSGSGQPIRAIAKSPPAIVPDLRQHTPVTHTPTANMGTGRMAAQNMQRPASIDAQRHQAPAMSFSSSSLDSRQQQTSPRTSARTIYLNSSRPTLSRHAQSPPSYSPHGQKRHADTIPEGQKQGQKRPAIAATTAPLDPGRYQTPSLMQRLKTAKTATSDALNKTKPVAPPIPNPQDQLLKEQQTYKMELFERQRLAEEKRLDRERRIRRKEELKKDPSALYRHYNEFLEYYPLQSGEYRSPYHSRLLANQRMPMEPESDLGVAITYAKEHWEIYMEYPRDVKRAAEAAKAKLQT